VSSLDPSLLSQSTRESKSKFGENTSKRKKEKKKETFVLEQGEPKGVQMCHGIGQIHCSFVHSALDERHVIRTIPLAFLKNIRHSAFDSIRFDFFEFE